MPKSAEKSAETERERLEIRKLSYLHLKRNNCTIAFSYHFQRFTKSSYHFQRFTKRTSLGLVEYELDSSQLAKL